MTYRLFFSLVSAVFLVTGCVGFEGKIAPNKELPSQPAVEKKHPIKKAPPPVGGSRERLLIISQQKALFDDRSAPQIGNPKGDVTFVEFFDYNCGHCRELHQTMQSLLAKDKGLRLVLWPAPILGEQSRKVSMIALAAHQQGKFQIFHDALMKNRGRVSEKLAYDVAQSLGLDIERLRKDVGSTQVGKMYDKAMNLRIALSIRGVPAVLHKNGKILGAAPIEKYVEDIKVLRSQ